MTHALAITLFMDLILNAKLGHSLSNYKLESGFLISEQDILKMDFPFIMI
jgi:hypothetical protein